MRKRNKKNRNLGPRRKRMSRPARLIAAAKWRSSYGGNHIVKSYARWFGIDLICAVVELRMIGIDVAPEYEQQLRLTIAARAKACAKRAAEKLAAKTRPIEIEWLDDWPVEWIPTDDGSSIDSIPF